MRNRISDSGGERSATAQANILHRVCVQAPPFSGDSAGLCEERCRYEEAHLLTAEERKEIKRVGRDVPESQSHK